MTHEQYIQAGMIHTKKDQEIDWSHVRYQVNSHVSWLAKVIQYGKDTDQERMAANLVSGQDLPDMSLLVKDHRIWSFESGTPVPTRPVVSGNCTIDTHLSINQKSLNQLPLSSKAQKFSRQRRCWC